MSTIPENTAKNLLSIKAVKLSPFSPFTWTSGLLSPIYCDNRIILSYPQIRKNIINNFITKIKSLEAFDCIIGVATAGIPHGALIAYELDVPFAYVRSKPKEHGRQNQIEGEVKLGSKALVVEDLISTGKSSIAAVHALREAQIIVNDVVGIFSYGFPETVERFKSENINLNILTDFDKLINIAEQEKYITTEEKKYLMDWNQSPKKWSDNQK